MSRYKECKVVPFDGDIIAVMENVYDEASPLKRWDARFVKRKRYYKASAVRNNGAIWAKGIDNKHKWLNVKDVIACYRKGVA